jgi:hypothetical protein
MVWINEWLRFNDADTIVLNSNLSGVEYLRFWVMRAVGRRAGHEGNTEIWSPVC